MLDVLYYLRPLPIDRVLPKARRAIPDTLEAAGHRVAIRPDGTFDPSRTKLIWMNGNPSWFPRALRQLRAMPAEERPFVVTWHSEPLPPPAASGLAPTRLDLREMAKIALRREGTTDSHSNQRRLRELHREDLLDLLVVSGNARRAFLAEQGIEAHWVPFGYHPADGRHLGLERDIDVLLLGARTIARREKRLKRLRQEGIEVVAKGSWEDPSCWGEARTELLNRSKILVNLQRCAGDHSHIRLILGGANRALVISEPMVAPEPFEAGRHFVSATMDEMPATIRHYLDHEAEREAILDETERFVTREIPMSRSVARIVELIEEHPRWRSIRER